MWFNRFKWMLFGAVITFLTLFVIRHCEQYKKLSGSASSREINIVNPEFAAYISAHTAGFISTGSTVRIKFTGEMFPNIELNKALEESYFTLSPSVKGTTVWKDATTMEFKPAERLEPGREYKVTYHLGKLLNVKDELKDFEFAFQTVRQSAQLFVDELKTYGSSDFSYYQLSGKILTADWAEHSSVQKLLKKSYGGRFSEPKWTHNETGTVHQFVIDSIQRPRSGHSNILLEFDGSTMGGMAEKKELPVPGADKFELLSVTQGIDDDRFIRVSFSNPLQDSHDLSSYITLDATRAARYLITANQVLVYPENTDPGTISLEINEGIRDAHEQRLEETSKHVVVFEQMKPMVRFFGEGSIITSTQKHSVIFETVNLRAVDVEVIRIFENNIMSFLQANNVGDARELARYGKSILRKRVNLGINSASELAKWKRYSLDLDDIFKTEPGAIYRVQLKMRKAYASYPCAGEITENGEMEEIREVVEKDVEFGYYLDYDEEGWNDNEDYDWSQRNNPCNSYYYRSAGFVGKNILASDIGITVKKGNDGQYFVATTDLVTAKPMSGVKLEMFDFHLQPLGEESTNGEGLVFFKPSQAPAFIVASKGKEKNYVRLEPGHSLNLSMYDVSGDEVKKGVKGFIYGERGVWRPGDTLFLNFILEDRQGNIPSNLPVIFDLYNPMGQLFRRLVSTTSVDGFYSFKIATDNHSPTGFWNAEVKVGTAKFSKALRIETVMPNRLKIDIDAAEEKGVITSAHAPIKLHTNWLTGAPARNFKATMMLNLTAGETAFEGFKDYSFKNEEVKFEPKSLTLFEGQVDGQGNASVPLNITAGENAPGMLNAAFTTMVFEPGGQFSIDRFTRTFSPFKYYAGIRKPDASDSYGILFTEKDHEISIATVNEDGKPVSRNNLVFTMQRMTWRWWWDEYEDEADYESDESKEIVRTEHISTLNGKGSVKVRLRNNEWGRYLLTIHDEESGHSATTVVYFDWSDWMNREGNGQNKALSSMLKFNTDKQEYKTGDEMKVTIPSAENGRALVTIENGSGVLEAHWLETEKSQTIFNVKITERMAPNVYVHVSLVQPYDRKNDLPIRLYGVVPVKVNHPPTHLEPRLQMPNVLVPEKPVTIQVDEKDGREMGFTIAVVDEGLLDLTRYKTPDPHAVFYAREALGVKTWDIYDDVIGAYAGELEKILKIGGDGSETGGDGAKANRFKPMVRFFGPFHLGKGEKKSVTFTMPSYIGSVRTMVIAASKGTYGKCEKTTPVKAPLMILGTLPRVLSVGEEVELPVSVFGGDKSPGQVNVSLQANGLFDIVNGNTRSVQVGKDDEKLVTFHLRVKSRTGVGKVRLNARGNGCEAAYDVELEVRNPNPFITTMQEALLSSSTKTTLESNSVGEPGTGSAVLEISSIPAIDLERRLSDLIGYPHGCIEQTTSQMFAQLYLDEIMTLTPAEKSSVEKNIRLGINRLRLFQLPQGAFSYWPDQPDPSDWGTSYAGHFIVLAEKKGYALPGAMKKLWLATQERAAKNYATSHDPGGMLQAYRLYVLALAGSPAWGPMNQLRESKSLANSAVWLLAGAYALGGQQGEARQMVRNKTFSGSMLGEYDYTYGSEARNAAIVLDVMCAMNEQGKALTQLRTVAASLSSQEWMSTQTAGYCLVSVSSFIRKFGGPSRLSGMVTINGTAQNIDGKAAIIQYTVPAGNAGRYTCRVENKGSGSMYVRLITRGKLAIGSETEGSNVLESTVSFVDMNDSPIDVSKVNQGENFKMVIRVSNSGLTGVVRNIALITNIPSGWEIHNQRFEKEDGKEDENGDRTNRFAYQDIRDDKVMTYFDLGRGQQKVITLLLNATYEGRFYLPGINAEAMYDNTVYTHKKGQWVEVVKATKLAAR